MIELNETNFDQVINSSDLILVDFWAPWCGPCRALTPILEKLSQTYQVAKVDVQEYPDLATRFGVSSIPTLMVFKRGKSVQTTIGLQNEQSLVKMMESIGG